MIHIEVKAQKQTNLLAQHLHKDISQTLRRTGLRIWEKGTKTPGRLSMVSIANVSQCIK